jgi:hypothetical protein
MKTTAQESSVLSYLSLFTSFGTLLTAPRFVREQAGNPLQKARS